MKKKIIVTAVIFVLMSSVAQARSVYQRFSSNPIGALNVIGVAMSESVGSANYVVDTLLKKMMRISVGFPLYADPSYKQLKAQAAVGISLFGQSAGGATYSSAARTLLGLGDYPIALIVIDRNKRVRGFCDSSAFEWDIMGRLLEELLLNIDNKEAITVGDKKAKDYTETEIQTDIARQREDEENKGALVLDLGASKNKWFKCLGAVIPDIKLKGLDGKATTLYSLISGKVTLVAVFIASSGPGAVNILPGLGSSLMVADGLYRDLALGEAKKGKKAVPNAFPDAVPPKGN